MFGKIVNGVLQYAPKDLMLDSGEVIVDFNQNEKLMLIYGYLPIEYEKPKYDEEVEYLTIDYYSTLPDKIKVVYKVNKINASNKVIKDLYKQIENKDEIMDVLMMALDELYGMIETLLMDKTNDEEVM